MSNYTTQMDAARKGIVTPEIEKVAKKEKMDVDKLMELVASGKVAIPANKHHKSLDAEGVGSMLRTKINVNLGVSRDCKDYDVEMQKVMSAVKLGAEAIMDLSSHGNTQPFRQKLTSECPAMIGTVPVYDSVIHYQRDLATLTAQDFVDVVRLHAEDGVDFVTLHCGITRKTIDQIKKHKRKMNIVSRGGSLVFAWMCMTGEENPFYEHYDEILEICEEHDVTISLGDACRPGCLADATDVCQIEELVRLGELTKRAWDHNVQVMVEGPGHVPLDQVAANMKVQQSICMGAPFYVLGPLVTDIAPGYDHITAAIGGAVAAMNGAAFLCYVTPAEHLALPNVEDTKQGIIASKIAAHAADIAKGIPGARDIDDKMADARRVLDWDAQFACALDPETAKAIRDDRLPEDDHSEACSMCGKFCAVRSMNKALAGEYIDIPTISIRKLAMAGVLVAVAVAGSLISFPVAGSKCAPIQHMVNICAAVFLGPVWGVGVAFCASVIRNLTGLGSLMAFPGSMVGALCCGLMYRFSKKIIPTCVAEALGTGILGGLAAYPLAKYVMLIQPEGMFIYIVPFLISTVAGSIVAAIVMLILKKNGALAAFKGNL